MSRPAWMPSGNDIVRQLILAAIVAGAAYLVHQQLQAPKATN